MTLKERWDDLANTAYQKNCYTFTHFLSVSEVGEFLKCQKEFEFVGYGLSGGSPYAERRVIRFGNENVLGYVEKFPICCIYCRPEAPKFAEKLGHRDVLGALMNLGMERDVIGDIWIKEQECFFFCLSVMCEYICDNLTKIRHTNVVCVEAEQLPGEFEPERKSEDYIVTSERCDAVVAKVYHLSRGRCSLLFREKKIFVNSRQFENNSGTLKAGDVVSVRGCGKFEYGGVLRETRKGNITIRIEKYV